MVTSIVIVNFLFALLRIMIWCLFILVSEFLCEDLYFTDILSWFYTSHRKHASSVKLSWTGKCDSDHGSGKSIVGDLMTFPVPVLTYPWLGEQCENITVLLSEIENI